MNTAGPELGSLASRFFAYVQLRNIDVVRTGEIAPVLGISSSQENDLFRRLAGSGWVTRLKRGIYLVPPRLPAGGKYSPGVALILDRLMAEERGRYQICGPVAFNYYGFDNQVPSVTCLYNNRISGRRSIGGLSFQFIKVSDRRLGAARTVRGRDGLGMTYSSRTRTLVDAVYDWSRFDGLPRGYGWIRNEIEAAPGSVGGLAEVAGRFGNIATVRRIGYLLDTLIGDQNVLALLQGQLSTSRALIPWVPARPARGTINRKWGIIVNG